MNDTTTEPTTESEATGTAATDDREINLELQGVRKVFDDGSEEGVVAVKGIDIAVPKGEFLVLVGPSGCGKTTTLRTIAGLEHPTEGAVLINGRDVSGQEPRARDIAMVFQNYALYPHKTVEENIRFPLEIRGYPAEEVAERVADTTAMLGIDDLLDRRPSDLSGGQQQRVALGRAIVRDPEVFLFDEPLSNLDAKLRIQMRTELNKLHERVGKTSVYVTHDQAEAMTLGDRVAVMNDGELQQLDDPQTVYTNPVNRFVAGFIGEPPMNFFDASIDGDGDGRHVVGDFFDIALTAETAAAFDGWDGDPANVEVGIRPDHFVDLDVTTEPSITERIEGVVKVVEPMGSHIDLTMAPTDRVEDESAEFTARVSNDSAADVGDTVTLGVDVRNLNVFDGTTGENVLVD